MKHAALILLLFVPILLISGCGANKSIKTGDSLEVAFDKAKNQYDRGKYADAARSFETVLSLGRGSALAQDAQFYLSESYYNSKDYLLAAAEYNRYYTSYPRSERRQSMEFKEALCYVKMSPRYKLDQSDTRRALELMLLFVSRYPGSDEATEATRYVDELRGKLAQKIFHSGEMYFRIKLYEAAAIYYDLTIDRYPETPWAEKALAQQINAYVQFARNSVEEKQLERYRMAISSYQKYLQLFPRGSSRSLVETYFETADREIRLLEQNFASID